VFFTTLAIKHIYLDKGVKTEENSSQIEELFIIQFRSLELIVLLGHGFLNPIVLKEAFSVSSLTKSWSR